MIKREQSASRKHQVGVKIARIEKTKECREGRHPPRTASAPPLFGVNNWPAMRDGISSTGFLPMLIASWNCNHGWTWHVGKKSFRITARGLRMASIDRSSKRPSIHVGDPPSRASDYPPSRWTTGEKFPFYSFAAISFSYIIRHSIIHECVALSDNRSRQESIESSMIVG